VSRGPLCIGLRFRPQFSSEEWARTLRALVEWEPALAPTHVHRRDDPNAIPREPWSDSFWPELVRRAAGDRPFSWGLEHLDEVKTSLDVGRGLHQNDVTIALDPPDGDLGARFVELLEAIRGGAEPALGFMYECGGPDAELAMQGRQRLVDVPPLLYLDAAALQRAGGADDLPCRRRQVGGGGAVLDVRDPWRRPTEQERECVRAVERLLGVLGGSPV
jgi:hypothetical protein